jgi:hypothetical protein
MAGKTGSLTVIFSSFRLPGNNSTDPVRIRVHITLILRRMIQAGEILFYQQVEFFSIPQVHGMIKANNITARPLCQDSIRNIDRNTIIRKISFQVIQSRIMPQ